MRAPPQARHAWRPSDVFFAQIEGDGQRSGIAGALSRRESAWALRPLELGELENDDARNRMSRKTGKKYRRRDRPTPPPPLPPLHTHTRIPNVETNSSEVPLTEGCGSMPRTAIQVSGVSKATLLPTARGRGDELRGARRFRYQKSSFGYLER